MWPMINIPGEIFEILAKTNEDLERLMKYKLEFDVTILWNPGHY